MGPSYYVLLLLLHTRLFHTNLGLRVLYHLLTYTVIQVMLAASHA